jgi:hypothetical protein
MKPQRIHSVISEGSITQTNRSSEQVLGTCSPIVLVSQLISNQRPTNAPDCKVTDPSGQARDEELQEQLWDLILEVLKGLGDLPYLRE